MTPPPEDRRATRVRGSGRSRGGARRPAAARRPTPDPTARPEPRPEPARKGPDRWKARPSAGPPGRRGPRLRGGSGRPAGGRRPPPGRAGPAARPAQARHWGVLASFVLLVLLPFAASVWYLYTRAADQYHSEIAFSVRSEEGASAAAAGILGALTQIGRGSASDTDILFDYIRSQEIVEAIDAELDLRAIYNRAAPATWCSPSATTPRSRRCSPTGGAWSRSSYEFDRRHHPRARQRLHPRGRQRDRRGDPRRIRRAGEPALRPGARGRGALRPRRARRGRGATCRTRARARRLPPRATASSTPAADVAGQMGLLNALQARARPGAGRARRAAVLRRAGRPAGGPGRPPDRRDRASASRPSAPRSGVAGRAEARAARRASAPTRRCRSTSSSPTPPIPRRSPRSTAARAEARRQSRYLAPHVAPTLADDRALPAPGAARRADRAVPAARLGRRHARSTTTSRDNR